MANYSPQLTIQKTEVTKNHNQHLTMKFIQSVHLSTDLPKCWREFFKYIYQGTPSQNRPSEMVQLKTQDGS